MFSFVRGQPEFVDEVRFSHVSLVQVPPEGGIGTVVRHAEHGAFNLAVQLAGKGEGAPGFGINEGHGLKGR